MKKKRTVKANPRRVQDTDITIGERIKARRNQIEMSQEELGDALKVSFQQIQKYEKGINRLSSGRLIQLAEPSSPPPSNRPCRKPVSISQDVEDAH